MKTLYEKRRDKMWKRQLGVKTFKEARAKGRLEEIRKEIKAERISYGEIAELQSLVKYIDENDTELLEWAGVCEVCGKIGCSCEI